MVALPCATPARRRRVDGCEQRGTAARDLLHQHLRPRRRQAVRAPRDPDDAPRVVQRKRKHRQQSGIELIGKLARRDRGG